VNNNEMKKIYILLLYSVFYILHFASAQGVWTTKATFPGIHRLAPFCFSIADKGYIGCGDTGLISAKDFWQYDTTLNVWTQIADFGGGKRNRGVSFSIGNYGYAGAGMGIPTTYNKDIWQYNPTSN